MAPLSKSQRQFAAHVRFLRERRLWSFGRIGRRFWMPAEKVEGVYRQAVGSNVRPEEP